MPPGERDSASSSLADPQLRPGALEIACRVTIKGAQGAQTRTFAAFEAALDADGLGAVLAARSMALPGAVNMPAFGFKTDSGLKPALMALGMNQAFDASVADLSAIDGRRDLYVSDVLHQATIAVDEMGTEASAATAVVIRTQSAVLNPSPWIARSSSNVRHDASGAIPLDLVLPGDTVTVVRAGQAKPRTTLPTTSDSLVGGAGPSTFGPAISCFQPRRLNSNFKCRIVSSRIPQPLLLVAPARLPCSTSRINSSMSRPSCVRRAAINRSVSD